MSDERSKKTCAFRDQTATRIKTQPTLQTQRRRSTEHTIFNGIDALSLFPDQALAGDPFSIAIVSSNLPDMMDSLWQKLPRQMRCLMRRTS